jgi:aminomethyltransferase
VNLLDHTRGDDLWDKVAAAGEEFDIRPIAPCEGRRIEAGIFNYGSDIRLGDTPFHVMGLERLVEEQPQDYIGKAALEELRVKGVDRKLVGIELEGEELRAEMSEYWYVFRDGKQVGHVTDAVWSPGLKKNIGYVWVPIELAEPGNRLDVETEDGEHLVGTTAAIPFVDPRKEQPAGALKG